MLFVSGWAGFGALFPGLAADFYLPFVEHGEQDIVAAVAQAGQCGQSGNRATLVGWSSGAHILLKRCQPLFPMFAKVLLLAPFTGFTDHVPAAEVAALADNLERSPAAALRGFYRRCGISGGLPALSADLTAESVAKLIDGLDYLARSRAVVTGLPDNVVLAHGEDDRIVPAAASRDLAASGRAKLAIVPGGHYFQPDRIHELLA
jgi:acetyl esterase/lipase